MTVQAVALLPLAGSSSAGGTGPVELLVGRGTQATPGFVRATLPCIFARAAHATSRIGGGWSADDFASLPSIY